MEPKPKPNERATSNLFVALSPNIPSSHEMVQPNEASVIDSSSSSVLEPRSSSKARFESSGDGDSSLGSSASAGLTFSQPASYSVLKPTPISKA